MSATIPNGMLLSDLLKATGYDCPDDLQGKTFSQATSGGEADLEANHASTVDVGEYTQPIEITPAEGKDGMEKVTLTLTNIPQAGEGGSVTVEALSVTENGTYTAPSGKAYSPVTVNVPSGGSWQTKTGELNLTCAMVRVVFTDGSYAYGCLGDTYEDDGVIYPLFFAMGKDYNAPIEASTQKSYAYFEATDVMDWLTQTYNTNFSASKVADHLEVYL